MNIPYNYIQQLKQLSVTGQGEGTLQSNPEYNRKKRSKAGKLGAKIRWRNLK